MGQSGLEILSQKAVVLKQRLMNHADEVLPAMIDHFGIKPKYVVFLSISDTTSRALVFTGTAGSLEGSWLHALNKCKTFLKAHPSWEPFWVKADLVNKVEACTYEEAMNEYATTRSNYVRTGLAFDKHFMLAFLEQEVLANRLINVDAESGCCALHLKNVNQYLKNGRMQPYVLKKIPDQPVFRFSTLSYFADESVHRLHTTGLQINRRDNGPLDGSAVFSLIDQSSRYLASQVGEDGKFVYGYFPCFHKLIPWYNMLRHASTVYSMVEAYEWTRDRELKQAIHLVLNYLCNNGVRSFRGCDGQTLAYIVDMGDEIKLGANAAAILALTKYSSVFGSEFREGLLPALAEGMMAMQDPGSGAFVHVLHASDLSVKEKFRIVYYDGEAAFALMRLYEQDRNPRWLDSVERAFGYFIAADHWKHHDHWLSYCTNELVKVRPQRQYFEFGLRNVSPKLPFILQRDTTYPTFLELLLASYEMAVQLERTGLDDLPFVDPALLLEAIMSRAEHQLNGFFYPEVAMYFKAPADIVGAFYIRHHAFRCRIDDIEHNLSGYCNVYKQFFASGSTRPKPSTAAKEGHWHAQEA